MYSYSFSVSIPSFGEGTSAASVSGITSLTAASCNPLVDTTFVRGSGFSLNALALIKSDT